MKTQITKKKDVENFFKLTLFMKELFLNKYVLSLITVAKLDRIFLLSKCLTLAM